MGFASKLEKRKSLQQMQESFLNTKDMELNSIKRYYEDRGKFLANLKEDFEKYRKKALKLELGRRDDLDKKMDAKAKRPKNGVLNIGKWIWKIKVTSVIMKI